MIGREQSETYDGMTHTKVYAPIYEFAHPATGLVRQTRAATFSNLSTQPVGTHQTILFDPASPETVTVRGDWTGLVIAAATAIPGLIMALVVLFFWAIVVRVLGRAPSAADGGSPTL